jgi:hypothetical protein
MALGVCRRPVTKQEGERTGGHPNRPQAMIDDGAVHDLPATAERRAAADIPDDEVLALGGDLHLPGGQPRNVEANGTLHTTADAHGEPLQRNRVAHA